MRDIDTRLLQIEKHLQNSTYEPVETDKIELKDLSGGDDWKELYKTTCAFLNTRGGIIIIGIKEDPKNQCFKFTGFNPNNENKLKELPNLFTDDTKRPIDVSEFIRTDLIEIKPFLTGQICLLFVEKLPDELKYVLYKGEGYDRQLTGDHRVPPEKINRQKELKLELHNTKELQFVPNTTLNDLDIDKLNDYIIRLNKDLKVESLKPDIPSAISFLSRKMFIREQHHPTFLGMLVCGKHLYDFVKGRCQVDCYYDTGNEIANDKKVYKDNIIGLLESCIAFVFGKINTGISSERGGTTIYEYPERVIRETVNNALAHRDYNNDRFANLTIELNKHIEVRNPGRFREEQLLVRDGKIALRRIIPIPKAQNPNLADVLKSFDRWEGKGWGMAALTDFSLANEIDLPYYRLYPSNDIGLFIPKGKILDDEMIQWLDSFSKYIRQKTKGKTLNNEQKTVLSYFYKSELLNALERYTVNLTPDNNHFEVIKTLEDYGLVEKEPDSPSDVPIYFIDRTLTRTDFTDEINALFGSRYYDLSNEYKQILEAIYKHNKYSEVQEVSANLIGNYLYLKKFKRVNDQNSYNNFKRKIRSTINKLEKGGFIRRKQAGKPNYELNEFNDQKLFNTPPLS